MTALSDAKQFLRLTHDADDEMLSRLIGAAARECLAFMDNPAFPLPPVPGPGMDVDFPEDVFQAVILMAQAGYDGDPLKRPAYRAAAEQLLWPYKSF